MVPEPRDTRDTRLNASQDGFRGETVRGNPEGRKGGRVFSRRGPHCATSPAVFRKRHRRGVPTRLAFGRYRRIGHLPALPHPQPCLAFGRDWRGGVAIELRPILQPTSLRARWTPCRDEFRVVRDDRRLVIMGAGHQERTSRALWVSRRVGHSGRSNPEDGQTEGPGTDDEVPRRTCLECAVEGTIEGQTRSGDTRGNPRATGWGKDSRVCCALKGEGAMRVEGKPKGEHLGTLKETGAARPPPPSP